MINEKDLRILKSLILIPSPSGFEQDVAEFIHDEVKKINQDIDVEIDFQKNVIVKIPGKTDKTVMIDAHSDEIGFIITNVDRWGKISIQYIGGGDTQILSARNLEIITNNGSVPAVVDRKHSHLVWDEDTEAINSVEQAHLDIGTKNRDEILKKIQIGDPVVYESNFRHLNDDYFSGYGFDDKSGCFMLLNAIEQIVKSRRKPECNLIFVFSAQEETANSKLFPVVRKYKPNLVIEADVTFATDYGEADDMENEVGRCNLGEGIVLYRGVDIDKNCFRLATQIAKTKNIKVQVQACSGRIGYTSLEVTGEIDGVRALVFGIPIRNMHSPVEVLNYKDLEGGTRLLKELLLSRNLSKNI